MKRYRKDGRCSGCGKERDRPGQTFCKSCHAAWMRDHRPVHSTLTNEQRRRLNCRAYTKTLQKRGRLPVGPCEGCGAADAGNHHPDYKEPRYFVRLCRDCHRSLEASIRANP